MFSLVDITLDLSFCNEVVFFFARNLHFFDLFMLIRGDRVQSFELRHSIPLCERTRCFYPFPS